MQGQEKMCWEVRGVGSILEHLKMELQLCILQRPSYHTELKPWVTHAFREVRPQGRPWPDLGYQGQRPGISPEWCSAAIYRRDAALSPAVSPWGKSAQAELWIIADH